jgi:hypothetical protein
MDYPDRREYWVSFAKNKGKKDVDMLILVNSKNNGYFRPNGLYRNDHESHEGHPSLEEQYGYGITWIDDSVFKGYYESYKSKSPYSAEEDVFYIGDERSFIPRPVGVFSWPLPGIHDPSSDREDRYEWIWYDIKFLRETCQYHWYDASILAQQRAWKIASDNGYINNQAIKLEWQGIRHEPCDLPSMDDMMRGTDTVGMSRFKHIRDWEKSEGNNQLPVHDSTLFRFTKQHADQLTLAEEKCAICQDNYKEGDPGRVLWNCDHFFHQQCIDPWLDANHTCPTCRNQHPSTPPHMGIYIGEEGPQFKDIIFPPNNDTGNKNYIENKKKKKKKLTPVKVGRKQTKNSFSDITQRWRERKKLYRNQEQDAQMQQQQQIQQHHQQQQQQRQQHFQHLRQQQQRQQPRGGNGKGDELTKKSKPVKVGRKQTKKSKPVKVKRKQTKNSKQVKVKRKQTKNSKSMKNKR